MGNMVGHRTDHDSNETCRCEWGQPDLDPGQSG